MTENMIGEYLEFLDCSACCAVSRENLFALQKAHLEKIPYNNLEILASRVPALDEDLLFEKIIRRKRGGYCFELNGLFAALLRALGYSVKEYFARWHFGGEEPVPMRRHRVIEVVLGAQTFIADAGIGSAGSVIPFELIFDKIQERKIRNCRFVQTKALGIVLQTETEKGWVPYYSFTCDPHYPRDFEYANFYCAVHPQSIFRSKFFMHRQTETVQYYIEDLQQPGGELSFCIRKSKTDIEKTLIKSKAQLSRILKNCFALSWTAEELDEIHLNPALSRLPLSEKTV